MPKQQNRGAQLVVALDELRDAVADGWVIDPPVERKQIPERPDGAWYCDVVMWREGRVRLLTLPDEPTLRQFLSDFGL